MKDTNATKRGFSVMELLMYGALFAIISVFALGTVILVTKTISQARVERSLSTNGELIMQKIVREARMASSFNASSTFNTSPGTLSLQTIAGPTDYSTSTAEFYTNAGQLYFKKGVGTPILLNSSDVSITNLVFRRITATSSTYGVKIEMTLQATTTPASASSRNFYASAMFRGSY